jgi:pimeloyl-ACP methyl ester carboxylesterase
MFPNIEPFETGMLAVGDSQEIYWECSGNPNGRPAVYLHGGPGSGCIPQNRRYFDPATYKIILADQRGCGRSRPHVTEISDLEVNTTSHLIQDLERLREHLRIDRWAVVGGSWGTTLGLAYAQAFPHRVTSIGLACVTTTSPTNSVLASDLKEKITGNPLMKKKGRDWDSSIPALVANANTRFFVCNLATHGYASRFAKQLHLSAKDVYEDLASHLIPNAMLVPAGVWAIHAIQERQYTLLQFS